MPLSRNIPELEEYIITQCDFEDFAKWRNWKSDKGRQAETAGRHRIPSLRRV
jgi:hypothetical protein